ncbi:hypothetical protein Ade02nite_19610 [Paractinoplanes deccanensis]|uniref:Phage head morphogenesis domain-containing protein n=1 Tax=Paractinoplanes deccanensis TaxID=113561 RepID=A0ABQ3Y0D9_9ACTN|nr:phage minor head protein [Actinoplanes deccanensis]GID73320.1 hypothetical protein Ade02nite_19610 [Actinoplanes deccanensis]
MAVPQRTLTLLRRLARSNGATVDATVQALTRSWLAAWEDLSPAWQQAIDALLEQYERTGVWPSPWQVARIEAIAAVQQRTDRALTGLVGKADTATRRAVAEVSAATVQAEPDIIASQKPGLKVRAADRQAVVSELSARRWRITNLHRAVLDAASSAIRRPLLRPPLATQPTAAALTGQVRAGFDSALVRATTIAQTETVDTYRAASALVHDANRGVLDAWAWHCACDRRSCTACWAMHGRQFPLEVIGPDGHPACRCTRLPLAAGVNLPSAEARFRRLPRRDQLAILGPARLELFRSGRIGWADLAVQRNNPGWRTSWTPASVADLRRAADLAR